MLRLQPILNDPVISDNTLLYASCSAFLDCNIPRYGAIIRVEIKSFLVVGLPLVVYNGRKHSITDGKLQVFFPSFLDVGSNVIVRLARPSHSAFPYTLTNPSSVTIEL